MSQEFSIVAVLQGGRIGCEALLFAASLARISPRAEILFFEPQPSEMWDEDPRANSEIHQRIKYLGGKIHPFKSKHFGQAYPHGNKIEALLHAPQGKPFVFFDTDTLFLGDPLKVDFPFDAPTGSARVGPSWPKSGDVPISHVWRSLYNRFGLNFGASQDKRYPANDRRRYPYFNAGFFCGPCPYRFGASMRDKALSVWRDPPEELEGQSLTPWLDQIVLPLVIHEFGGGRAAQLDGVIDGSVSLHWRWLPLLYVREELAAVELLEEIAAEPRFRAVLKSSPAFTKLVYDGEGRRLRNELAGLASDETQLRKAIKAQGLWLR